MRAERRLPKIGEYIRGQGTLVTIEEVVPMLPQVNKDYIFEEITARVELRLGDEILKGLAECWDFYGKESSVKIAIEDAQKYASERRIGPESEIEVVVIKTLQQTRKRPQTTQQNFYDESFYLFESIGMGSKARLPDPVETVVWSSKNRMKEL